MITLIIVGFLIMCVVRGLTNPRDWSNFHWGCLLVLMAVIYLEGLAYINLKRKEKDNGNMG